MCTAHGIAGCFQFLEAHDLRKSRTDTPETFGSEFTPISRMMIYAGERIIENTLNTDAGAEIRDGVKYLHKVGVCEESFWPYTKENLTKAPSAEALEKAKGHRISSYYRLVSLNDMLHCLSQGYPFVFGSYLMESFMSDAVARTGMVPDPKGKESPVGGHCMMCIGYDSDTKLFHVVNSWSDTWGIHGTCYMSYSYLANPNLTDDIWTLRR